MNRVEQILSGISLNKKTTMMDCMEQTALEFSKWKDENYYKQNNLYCSNSTGIGERTLYQLFNEWKNQIT